MNCKLPDGAMIVLLFGVVNVILVSVAVVTVTVAVPTLLPKLAGAVAVMVVDPGEMAVVIPLLFPELLTEATLLFVEAQLQGTVRSCVLPSLKVPVALRLTMTPAGMVTLAGAISTLTNVALLTVNTVVALTEPEAAVMVVVPGAKPFATALWTGIVATLVADELQLAVVVILCVLPSLNVPIAVKA